VATNVLKGAVEGAIFLALATGLLLRFESKDKALTVRETSRSVFLEFFLCGFFVPSLSWQSIVSFIAHYSFVHN
jgi:hypothetical protein